MSKSTIAFIGLGNMGGSMAANLVKAGFIVRAYDLNPHAVEQAKGFGCIAAESALDAAFNTDIVITMLTTGEIVETLFLESPALFNYLKPASLVIDCSTIAPEKSKSIAEHAVRKKLRCIDAPVSGGTSGAKDGTLTFICGGKENDVALATPILLSMGKNVFHAGDNGAGQIAKACNNMLLAVQMAATAEALQMGVNSGLDAKTLSTIMLNSSGCNWPLEKYNPYPDVMSNVPANNNYQGGFMVNLMIKDLNIAMQSAKQSDSSTPLGQHAKQLFEQHQSIGENGIRDFSSILELYKKS